MASLFSSQKPSINPRKGEAFLVVTQLPIVECASSGPSYA
jgi:hypothetical protein